MSETVYALGGDDLYDPADGRHDGRFYGSEVYSPTGTYLGELTTTGRLGERDREYPPYPPEQRATPGRVGSELRDSPKSLKREGGPRPRRTSRGPHRHRQER